jgi:hypothetical protein
MAIDNVIGLTKHHPLEVLADLLQAAVPAFRNTATVTTTIVGAQTDARDQTWPSLQVWIPDGVKWIPEFWQPKRIARELNPASPRYGRKKTYEVPGTFTAAPGSIGNIVFAVGQWSGMVQLRLGARSPKERVILEQAIVDVFSAERGVISMPVPKCANARHTWMMGDTSWNDERIFDRALFSELDLIASHPILVELRGVRRIEHLRLRFTEDMFTDFASIPDGTIETFDVNADGSITRI